MSLAVDVAIVVEKTFQNAVGQSPALICGARWGGGGSEDMNYCELYKDSQTPL